MTEHRHDPAGRPGRPPGGRAPGRRPLVVAVALLVALAAPACGDDAGAGAGAAAPSTSRPRPAQQVVAATTTTTTTLPTPTTAPRAPAIDTVDLTAAPVRVACPGGPADVRLDGRPGADGRSARIIARQPVDLTGDTGPEAVLVAACAQAPGADIVTSVVIVRSDVDGPKQVGGPLAGHGISVTGDTLVVTRTVAGPRDPACCPTQRFVPVTVEGDTVVEGGGDADSLAADIAGPAGLGALPVDATYPELALVSGRTVEVADPGGTGGACVYVRVAGGPGQVRGLGGEGTLLSVEVANPALRTDSDLAVGSTDAQVAEAYPDLVETLPHPTIAGGRLLVVEPPDSGGLVVVFDLDGPIVTKYRVGDPDWALAIDGC